MSILIVNNLKKVYTSRFGLQQVQALSNISFSVEEGEFVAIMGESGSERPPCYICLHPWTSLPVGRSFWMERALYL